MALEGCRSMNKYIIYILYIILYIVLSGCASAPGLYAELGVGYQVKASETERPSCHTAVLYDEQGSVMYGGSMKSCGGDNPQATISVGWEFREGGPLKPDRVEWLHRSNYLDGSSYFDSTGGNSRETYTDELRAVWKVGGRD